MPLYLQAGLWGLLSGSALIIGAALAYVPNISQRFIAAVTAFGAGVLIAVLSFELMEEAYRRGGFASAALGFLFGAAVFTAANVYISRRGGHARKRSGKQQSKGSGLAIAIGALLDGIPESVVIGVGLLMDARVSLVAVAGVFLSNLPEALSSASGMRKAGRPPSYVFAVWGGIMVAAGIAAMLGNLALAGTDPNVAAVALSIAAGAILAMLVDTMIPEAFETTHEYSGLITVLGFLVAFLLSKLTH